MESPFNSQIILIIIIIHLGYAFLLLSTIESFKSVFIILQREKRKERLYITKQWLMSDHFDNIAKNTF